MANTINPVYDMMATDYITAKNAQANRPIQTGQTTKPLEYDDILARRNQIGAERAALAKALDKRDNFGYRFANALSQMPAQQGYGSWLGDFARMFGAAYNARTDMRIDKAERDYENAQKDLATALAYNKALGEEQTMDYKPVVAVKREDESVPTPATQADWEYWFENWDKDRPSERSYNNMNQLQRKVHNTGVKLGVGDKDEATARKDLQTYFASNFLPMARETLKGTGQISNFEDMKYTKWIEEAGEDPGSLKNAAVRIVMDASNANGFSDAQKLAALKAMNLQSDKEDLTEEMIKQNPLRVRGYELPGQDSGWTVLGNGVKIRKKQ